MQMLRVWVRASMFGVCKASTSVRQNGGNAGWISLSVSILRLTAAQEVRYVHSFTVYGARAVNFYVTTAMNNYGASAINNQEPTPTEWGEFAPTPDFLLHNIFLYPWSIAFVCSASTMNIYGACCNS